LKAKINEMTAFKDDERSRKARVKPWFLTSIAATSRQLENATTITMEQNTGSCCGTTPQSTALKSIADTKAMTLPLLLLPPSLVLPLLLLSADDEEEGGGESGDAGARGPTHPNARASLRDHPPAKRAR